MEQYKLSLLNVIKNSNVDKVELLLNLIENNEAVHYVYSNVMKENPGSKLTLEIANDILKDVVDLVEPFSELVKDFTSAIENTKTQEQFNLYTSPIEFDWVEVAKALNLTFEQIETVLPNLNYSSTDSVYTYQQGILLAKAFGYDCGVATVCIGSTIIEELFYMSRENMTHEYVIGIIRYTMGHVADLFKEKKRFRVYDNR